MEIRHVSLFLSLRFGVWCCGVMWYVRVCVNLSIVSVVLGTNLSPMQEQFVLLTSEPYLQPHCLISW